MNGVEYIAGSKEVCNAPLQPYSDEACNFLADLSANIMKHDGAKRYPDVISFAFWCRKGQIRQLKATLPDATHRLGRGLCFHIAPSNIPVNFAFSWVFSLLAGNSNIVRLPSKIFPQTELICEITGRLLRGHPEIEKRSAFIRYPVNDNITAEFSKMADARMIWGGDKTVESIKKMPSKPRCADLTFPDRYSICVINGQAVSDADDTGILRLAEGFYNDAYIMDQNACSSPQLVLWLNGADTERERFWDAVRSFASGHYGLQAAIAVEKFMQMCTDSINLDSLQSVEHANNFLYRAQLTSISHGMDNLRGRGGYFYEYCLNSLDDMKNIITDKYQTLTQFGVDEECLRRFIISNSLRGIDRIVPVGKAMDINVIWDGYDLIRNLSRIVNIE